MKLIIGLGNPGEKYEKNRHNVGHMFIEYLIQNSNVKSQNHNSKVKLFKTDTFMNDSGRAVKRLIVKSQLSNVDDLMVVHDDLDIKLGEFKIQKGKGPRLHNGIESVEKALETSDFWRVRIGVDARDPENRIPGEKYVLMNFNKGEIEILNEVFDEIILQFQQEGLAD